MTLKQWGWLIILSYCAFGACNVCAKTSYREINKIKDFDKRLQKTPFTVVLFTPSNQYDALNEFNFAADQQKYKDNDVQFLLVNTSKKGLDILKHVYRASVQPSIILFNNGISVKNTQNNIAYLSQFTWQDIDDFINDYLGQDIQEYSQRKIERMQECSENDPYYPSWKLGLPWYGPYYPPYGWDPYWYGTNWYGCPRGY
jgi:hypothetical protein